MLAKASEEKIKFEEMVGRMSATGCRQNRRGTLRVERPHIVDHDERL
jgi:hypothetical protein